MVKDNRLTSFPKISIITVVWNAKQVLEQTILSVINQSYKNIEYIVIDGGSNDGTLDILKEYNHAISYWKSEPDKGIYDAMNKGITAATGDWVVFVGAGDLLMNVIHKAVESFSFPNYIYYGNVLRNDINKIYDGEFSGYKLAVSNICHQAIFYPTAALKKYKYELRYKALADHHLNMVLYGDNNFKFHHIPLVIAVYEGDGFSADNAVDVEFFNDKLAIIKANFSSSVYYYALLRNRLARLLAVKKN